MAFRSSDSDWRGRASFVAAITAACMALIVVLLPDFGRAIDALAGNPQARPLYPVRVELRPARAHHASKGDAGVTAALSPSDANEPDIDLLPNEGGEPGSHSELAQATGHTLAMHGPSSVLPLEFDISPEVGPGSSSSGGTQVDTTKPVSLNGVDAGSINVRVGRDSRIYLDRAGLLRALQAVDGRAAARIAKDREDQFLSLDDLRLSGVSVRYDPIADRIRLET